MLAAGKGSRMVIEAEGEDAESALAAVVRLIAERLRGRGVGFQWKWARNPRRAVRASPCTAPGVSGGIAIGHAHLVSTARLEVAHYEIAAQRSTPEIARFDAAIAQVRGELAALETSVSTGAPAR